MSSNKNSFDDSEPITLVWNQDNCYSHAEIDKICRFVNKHMNGMLPLFGKEKQILIKYSDDNNIPYGRLVGIRSHLRTQKEIFSSRFVEKYEVHVKNEFIKLIRSDKIKLSDVVKYMNSMYIAPNHIFKILSKNKLLDDIDPATAIYFNSIKKLIDKNNSRSLTESKQFEIKTENFLRSKNISFKTEDDLRKESSERGETHPILTPDILFDSPVKIIINGNEHMINWIDAKNYILINVKYIISNLVKQSKKYNNAFGSGAFIFNYGIDNSICIPGVLLLSSSDLDEF